jgi:hypothetical protein
MNNNLKEMVKGDKTVVFTHFRRNELWYKTDCGFAFAVPASDVGDATFNQEERAMLMLRYIRKQIATNAAGMAETLADAPVALGKSEDGYGQVSACW